MNGILKTKFSSTIAGIPPKHFIFFGIKFFKNIFITKADGDGTDDLVFCATLLYIAIIILLLVISFHSGFLGALLFMPFLSD